MCLSFFKVTSDKGIHEAAKRSRSYVLKMSGTDMSEHLNKKLYRGSQGCQLCIGMPWFTRSNQTSPFNSSEDAQKGVRRPV